MRKSSLIESGHFERSRNVDIYEKCEVTAVNAKLKITCH
jgi:hypothetical protein